MTIVRVGVCINGYVRKSGVGVNVEGKRQEGVTSPTSCEKCGGKGCPPVGRPAREA